MTFAAETAAGVAVPVCAFIPGPGWLMAAIIAAVVVAALVLQVVNVPVQQQHVHGFLPRHHSIPN